MAFGKKKLKITRIVRAILITIIIMGSISLAGYLIVNSQMSNYKVELNTMKTNLKRNIYMSKEKAIAGTIINNETFYLTEMYSSIGQDQYISEEDIGKALMVDIEPNIPIMKAMVSEEIIQKDLREEELNMFLLPSNLAKYQYIDVRIGFPNGEDYIVLSKKKIRDLQLSNNTIWLWVDEKEILTLSSAIVDAYLNKGSKLYTVTYVAPAIQEKAILNYPVNSDVLKVIMDNPNILDEAKKSLSDEARKLLNERLSKISDTETNSVENGVKEETTNRENKIAEEHQDTPQVTPNSNAIPENVPDEQSIVQEEKKESETFY